MGINSYSVGTGLSAATGITSRSFAYIIAIAFALLSLIPGAAALIATIPAPVVGAALFFAAAFVFISGLQAITARLLDSARSSSSASRLQWRCSLTPATISWRALPPCFILF